MSDAGIMLCVLLSFTLLQCCFVLGSLQNRCSKEEISVIIPYISDSTGVYKSSLNDRSVHLSQHVYISFAWNSRIYILDLERSVLSPAGAKVEWSEDNMTIATELLNTMSFQGQVIGDEGSFAALTLTGVMDGYIATANYEFVIESINNDHNTTGIHRLISCRKTDDHMMMGRNITSRHKRDASNDKKFIEVLVAVDTSVSKFVGKANIESYILTIMNIVNKIYKDDTLDSKIEVVTTEIILMDSSDDKSLIVTNQARQSVDRFCNWVLRNPKYARGTKHDVAVMFTRKTIGPAGYAPITGMCNPVRSCAVIRDEGFTSAFIVAHEIAHVIGVYHDGHGNKCHGREFQYSMMASMVQSTLQHYWWSTCSNDRIKQALPYLTCLNNDPFKDISKGVTDPLGKPFTMDEQCRYEFGENHISCRSYYGDLCDQLWCSENNNLRLCKTKRGRPLNGTPCSSGQYWCMKGKCEYHGNNKATDGGWGTWGEWSSCSTNCGVGIKRRSKKCDSPKPAYGGKPCEGKDKEVYTCSNGDNCSDYTDLRFLQCAVLNGIPIRGRSHTWLPYQKEKEEDQCKLNCISNDTGQVKTFDEMQLEDGTPCSYDNATNVCVQGSCWKVGCDGKRNSTVEYDKCGICGGNGSECKLVKGKLEKTFKYDRWPPEYERIIVLPQDSRGIEIIEEKTASHFMAIRDPGYGTYFMNGNRRKGHSKKMAIHGAWFEYNADWNRESLKSKGPLRRPIEIMILPQNKYQKAEISYEYAVSKDDFTFEKSTYKWIFDKWTECSVTCGAGTQHIVNKCIDNNYDTVTEDANCEILGDKNGKPVKCERSSCGTENYVWAMKESWSKCSVTCGGGIQRQEYGCERKFSETRFQPAELTKCDKSAEPNYTRSCNDNKCGSYQWESTDDWTPCPITCGFEGFQFEVFKCIFLHDDGERAAVEDSFCNGEQRPNISRVCLLDPCYQQWFQWGFNHEWTPCSQSCGNSGVQFPVFFCEQIDSQGFSDIVSIGLCDSEMRPENVSKPCNRDPCIFESFAWKYSEWSECSESCGDSGYQKRHYHCQRVYSNGTAESEKIFMCDDLPKPVDRRGCDSPPCMYSSFKLRYGPQWGDCSASCGTMGFQTQKTFCQELMPNGTISDVSIHMCDDLVALGETRPCNRIPCVTYKWTPAPFWTNCTATCGNNGLRYQMHYCDKVLEDGTTEFVHFNLCADMVMPFVSEDCNRRPCELEWEAGQWSECSVTCGSGTQKREVTCGDPTTESDDFLCPIPSLYTSQPCQMEDCPPEDASCVDRLSYCGRTASERRCSYGSFKQRCCRSCSEWIDAANDYE